MHWKTNKKPNQTKLINQTKKQNPTKQLPSISYFSLKKWIFAFLEEIQFLSFSEQGYKINRKDNVGDYLKKMSHLFGFTLSPSSLSPWITLQVSIELLL